MPLVRQTIYSEIRKINDSTYVGFEDFPTSISDSANRWANAVNEYAKSVIPPSSTSEQAKQAFIQVMQQVSVPSQNGFAILKLAFTAYASTLALGMAPTFIATPPPSPIILEVVAPLGLGGGSAEAVASAMSNIIDSWFKTGVAVNSGSGVSINWN